MAIVALVAVPAALAFALEAQASAALTSACVTGGSTAPALAVASTLVCSSVSKASRNSGAGADPLELLLLLLPVGANTPVAASAANTLPTLKKSGSGAAKSSSASHTSSTSRLCSSCASSGALSGSSALSHAASAAEDESRPLKTEDDDEAEAAKKRPSTSA